MYKVNNMYTVVIHARAYECVSVYVCGVHFFGIICSNRATCSLPNLSLRQACIVTRNDVAYDDCSAVNMTCRPITPSQH